MLSIHIVRKMEETITHNDSAKQPSDVRFEQQPQIRPRQSRFLLIGVPIGQVLHWSCRMSGVAAKLNVTPDSFRGCRISSLRVTGCFSHEDRPIALAVTRQRTNSIFGNYHPDESSHRFERNTDSIIIVQR
jgi:hypothetical protein